MTLVAPPLVLNLGLPVEEKDIQALKTLGLGRTHRLKWDIHGQCDNDEVNDDDNGCKFRVDGWVQIRHVSTLFPCAVLMVSGGADKVVDPATARAFADAARPFYQSDPERLRLVVYEGCGTTCRGMS